MPKITTITVDGDHTIRESQYVKGDASLILIESNVDVATLTPGYRNTAGTFSAFPDPDGLFSDTNGGTINHRAGDPGNLELMLNVSGIGTNPVVVRVHP